MILIRYFAFYLVKTSPANHIFIFLLTFICSYANASDHLDGEITVGDPVADITDFFAFPSPENEGHIVLILNTHPFAKPNAQFSDHIAYIFALRPVAVDGEGHSRQFIASGEEYRFDCRFRKIRGQDGMEMYCLLPSGKEINVDVEDNKVEAINGVRAFAGLRADPFLFSASWFETLAFEGCIPPPNANNDAKRVNVLSISLEIDVASLLGQSGQSLLAAYGETALVSHKDGSLKQLDRVGRPEMVNGHLVNLEGDPDIKSAYNGEATFLLSEEFHDEYKKVLLQNLRFYDSLDLVVDWSEMGHKQLVNIMLSDYLLVDLSKPFSTDGFLDIERSLIRSHAHTRAGGRVPGERIVNDWLTFTVSAGHGRKITDGIHPKPLSVGFPYLEKPNTGIFSWVARQFARGLIEPIVKRARSSDLEIRGDCE